MKTSLKLEGAKELSRALDALGFEVANKIGMAATRAAARALQAEAVATAPRGPGQAKSYRTKKGPVVWRDYGHLYENIRVRREREKKPYTIRFVVTTGKAFWGYFLEVGTAKMPARPWASPLFDRMKYQLLKVMLDTLRTGTKRAAKRLARGPARRSRAGIGHNGGPELRD